MCAACWAIILSLIYMDAVSAEYEITDISFGLGDGCLLFMAVTCRLKQQGETSRLQEAARKTIRPVFSGQLANRHQL